MTREDYERWWASGAGISPELAREAGMRAVPCNCGVYGCQGWQMDMSPEARSRLREAILRKAAR